MDQPEVYADDDGAPVQRFPMSVRYSYEYGYLSVQDPFDGTHHLIPTHDAPDSWRRMAAEDKKRRKLSTAA